MAEWIEEIFGEAQQQEELTRQRDQAAAEDGRKRALTAKAYDEQIDHFWATFLKELRDRAEAFNASEQVKPSQRITINTPEPTIVGLPNDDPNYGGQFVARLYKSGHRGEVNLLIARTITNIDCPIVVDESGPDLRLAFRSGKDGSLHDPKRAVEMLLPVYLRYTLGLLKEAPPKGERRIGF